jgi:hypothetical protein
MLRNCRTSLRNSSTLLSFSIDRQMGRAISSHNFIAQAREGACPMFMLSAIF